MVYKQIIETKSLILMNIIESLYARLLIAMVLFITRGHACTLRLWPDLPYLFIRGLFPYRSEIDVYLFFPYEFI